MGPGAAGGGAGGVRPGTGRVLSRKKKKARGGAGRFLAALIGIALAGFVIVYLSNRAASSPVTVPASPSEHQWVVALLEGLGDPRTAADEDSVTDWVAHESPWNDSYPDGALYTRNPLNSKLAVPGSELLVTGVEQYPSMTAGLDATIATLHDGWYPDILYQLHAGAGLVQDASAGLLKWSDGAYSSV